VERYGTINGKVWYDSRKGWYDACKDMVRFMERYGTIYGKVWYNSWKKTVQYTWKRTVESRRCYDTRKGMV